MRVLELARSHAVGLTGRALEDHLLEATAFAVAAASGFPKLNTAVLPWAPLVDLCACHQQRCTCELPTKSTLSRFDRAFRSHLEAQAEPRCMALDERCIRTWALGALGGGFPDTLRELWTDLNSRRERHDGLDQPAPAVEPRRRGTEQDASSYDWEAQRTLHRCLRDAFEDVQDLAERAWLGRQLFTMAVHRVEQQPDESKQRQSNGGLYKWINTRVAPGEPGDYRLSYLLSPRLSLKAREEVEKRSGNSQDDRDEYLDALKGIEEPFGADDPDRPSQSVSHTSVGSGLAMLIAGIREHEDKKFSNFAAHEALNRRELLLWDMLGLMTVESGGNAALLLISFALDGLPVGHCYVLLPSESKGDADSLSFRSLPASELLAFTYEARRVFRQTLRKRYYRELARALAYAWSGRYVAIDEVNKWWKALSYAFGFAEPLELVPAGGTRDIVDTLRYFEKHSGLEGFNDSPAGSELDSWPPQLYAQLQGCTIRVGGRDDVWKRADRFLHMKRYLLAEMGRSIARREGRLKRETDKGIGVISNALAEATKQIRKLQRNSVEDRGIPMPSMEAAAELFAFPSRPVSVCGRTIESRHSWKADDQWSAVWAAALLLLTRHEDFLEHDRDPLDAWQNACGELQELQERRSDHRLSALKKLGFICDCRPTGGERCECNPEKPTVERFKRVKMALYPITEDPNKRSRGPNSPLLKMLAWLYGRSHEVDVEKDPGNKYGFAWEGIFNSPLVYDALVTLFQELRDPEDERPIAIVWEAGGDPNSLECHIPTAGNVAKSRDVARALLHPRATEVHDAFLATILALGLSLEEWKDGQSALCQGSTEFSVVRKSGEDPVASFTWKPDREGGWTIFRWRGKKYEIGV